MSEENQKLIEEIYEENPNLVEEMPEENSNMIEVNRSENVVVPGEESSSNRICVKVEGMDNNVLTFKINVQTPLRKIITAYCQRVGIDSDSVRLRYDGNPIYDYDTPKSLDMEDSDVLEIYQFQTGGGTSFKASY